VKQGCSRHASIAVIIQPADCSAARGLKPLQFSRIIGAKILPPFEPVLKVTPHL
jgi:hypothetical protein